MLLAGAPKEFGTRRVVEWCGRLIREQGRVDHPDLGWLGGSEDWPRYWQRVRGTRGLLYVWADGALSDVQVVVLLTPPHE